MMIHMRNPMLMSSKRENKIRTIWAQTEELSSFIDMMKLNNLPTLHLEIEYEALKREGIELVEIAQEINNNTVSRYEH